MRAGHHLHRLRLRRIAGDHPQLMPIGAHHVGQRVRITLVALGTGRAVPVPVARHLPRIDRIHRVTRRDQRLHPGPLVGLDTDRHLIGPGLLGQLRTDQLVQPGDPGNPLRQPRPCQPATRLVLHLHIMMIFSPVVPDEQHSASSLAPSVVVLSSVERNPAT
jgi:hypothetical protein